MTPIRPWCCTQTQTQRLHFQTKQQTTPMPRLHPTNPSKIYLQQQLQLAKNYKKTGHKNGVCCWAKGAVGYRSGNHTRLHWYSHAVSLRSAATDPLSFLIWTTDLSISKVRSIGSLGGWPSLLSLSLISLLLLVSMSNQHQVLRTFFSLYFTYNSLPSNFLLPH